MNVLTKTALGFSSLALSTSVFALDLNAERPNHFSYNYADISYSDLAHGLDGFAVAFSYDIRNNIAVTGQMLTGDRNNPNTDYDMVSIGAGYHFKVPSMTDSDVLFHAELVHAEGSAGAFDDDDTGLRLGSKLRMNLQPGVEVFGDLSLTTVDEAGNDDILITTGLAYEFAEGVAGFVSYEFSDREWLQLGLRYYY